MRIYYFAIFVSPLLLMGIIFGISNQTVPSEYIDINIVSDGSGNNLREYRNVTILIIFTGFMYIAFYSVIFAFKRLKREGISEQTR